MAADHTCPVCRETFNGDIKRKYCSMTCRNKAPGRMSSESTRAKIGAAHRGDKAAMRRPEVAAKVSATTSDGRRAGPNHPRFKGEMVGRDKYGVPRMHVWIPPEERAALGIKGPYIRRAHLVWLKAHPGETIKRGEIIHHKDRDSLNDVPENLEKLPSQREHILLHTRENRSEQRHRRNWQPDTPCEVCGTPKRPWRRFCSVACTGKGQSGEKNPHFGRRHTDDVREAQRRRASGKKASPETREKMRQAHLARHAKKEAERS